MKLNALVDNGLRMFQACPSRFVLKVMGVMLAGLCGGSAPAFGDVFQGTFTEQILATDDTGLYSVGQTFFGNYQYTADSINGGFSSRFYHNGSGANKSLDGVVVMPFSQQTSYFIDFPTPGTRYYLNYGLGSTTNTLVNSGSGGALTVDNGQATAFTWSWDQGGFYFTMQCTNGVGIFQAASFYDTPSPLYTTGIIQFSDPTLIQTITVPEPGVTRLLAGAVGTVFFIRFIGLYVGAGRRKRRLPD